MKFDAVTKYPLLSDFLDLQGIAMKPAFTNQDVKKMFGTSVRTIQFWISKGKLRQRNLPGSAKILPLDLEALLAETNAGTAEEVSDNSVPAASKSRPHAPTPGRTTYPPKPQGNVQGSR